MAGQPPPWQQRPNPNAPGQHPGQHPRQMPPKKGGSKTLLIVLGIVGAIVLCSIACCIGSFLLMAPAITEATNDARNAAQSAVSQNNLRQIGMAIHSYSEVHNKLPAAIMPNEDGQPAHSWRTAILPFCAEKQLFDSVDFSKRWNEPPNTQLSSREVSVFKSSADKSAPGSHTSYVAIVGPGAAFDPNKQLSFRDIKDGLSNTIAVIEVPNSGISWMEPSDMPMEQAISFISNSDKPVNALLFDGTVTQISPTVDPVKLRAMMTRDAGDIAF